VRGPEERLDSALGVGEQRPVDAFQACCTTMGGGDDEPWALPASELSGKKRPDGRAAAGAMMGMGPRGARR